MTNVESVKEEEELFATFSLLSFVKEKSIILRLSFGLCVCVII
jgi:hypothetical protein